MEQNSKQDTALLRKSALRLRDSLPEELRAQKSEEIARLILQSDAYRRAESLLVYVSYKTEVSTSALIDRALAQGRRVYVPKVEGERMRFYRMFSDQDVSPGFRGSLEPAGDTAVWDGRENDAPVGSIMPQAIAGDAADQSGGQGIRTLLLAPGAAFDRNGQRIGYGGGFYDRFLGGIPKRERPYCIGLCFACQLVERIEPKEHDISMDRVIYA